MVVFTGRFLSEILSLEIGMKKLLLLLCVAFPWYSLAFRARIATWNILEDQFYKNPHGKAEIALVQGKKRGEAQALIAPFRMASEARKELLTQTVKKNLADVDIIALQEAQLETKNEKGDVVIYSLFKDDKDFAEALGLSQHTLVRAPLGDELVVLFRPDAYKLRANKSVPIWKDVLTHKSYLTKYAQIVELISKNDPETLIVVVNVHLKGEIQAKMVEQGRPQLRAIRDELRGIVRAAEVKRQRIFVVVLGDFNIDAAFKNPQTMVGKQSNYSESILHFIKNITVVRKPDPVLQGSALKRLHNPFKAGATGRPCTSKSHVTGKCEGLDYLLYGANFPIVATQAQIIPDPERINAEAMTHSVDDKNRTFPSDHAILKVSFQEAPPLRELGKEMLLLQHAST